jgi:hypothetical protein
VLSSRALGASGAVSCSASGRLRKASLKSASRESASYATWVGRQWSGARCRGRRRGAAGGGVHQGVVEPRFEFVRGE